ncbi:hypothetical protein X474_13820 [Dethiosulfatarculus sandiegensis]|uniref:Uncharacterized protein n=1 Tax=Dethiosulfatarculus sandiegensis TaxID=1429043 RepID=A0A0D2J623_9BACT|nr:hypothetical protein X474_13820 [Dethiosulfatarculus sandiegensis]
MASWGSEAYLTDPRKQKPAGQLTTLETITQSRQKGSVKIIKPGKLRHVMSGYKE